MGIIDGLLQDVALPRMARVRQIVTDNAIADVEATLRAAIRQPAIAEQIKPGASIAIGVGSAGLPSYFGVRALSEPLLRRPRFAWRCASWRGRPARRPRPIECGRPGPGLLAHVLVPKYARAPAPALTKVRREYLDHSGVLG